jgi:uncharacterized protein with von Willebrand factor type A (vWA) domain
VTSVPTSDLDPDLLSRLVGFGRHLRRLGLGVGTGRVLSFCRAAAALDAFDPDELRLAARATLASRPEDLAVLDEAFDRYFREGILPPGRDGDGGRLEGLPPPALPHEDPTGEVAAGWSNLGGDDDQPLEGETAIRIVASDADVVRTKDFAELTEDERRLVSRLIRRLATSVPHRRSRRYHPAADGSRFDVRATVRRSLRTEGEPFRRAWQERGIRQRPLVLILDVSGSMAPYSRPLIEFAHVAARAGRRVEVFCFGTRLTRITRALRQRDPAEALVHVAGAVRDWEGGTRIGDSLKELLDRWSTHTALRGSVVVLCSDGLERGDPAGLAKQMERLSRLAHRLVWVNPLKGSPRYEPLARGMAASLPFVDVFLPGHDLESLEELAATVSRP